MSDNEEIDESLIMPEFGYICQKCGEVTFNKKDKCKCKKPIWKKEATYFRVEDQSPEFQEEYAEKRKEIMNIVGESIKFNKLLSERKRGDGWCPKCYIKSCEVIRLEHETIHMSYTGFPLGIKFYCKYCGFEESVAGSEL